MQSANRHPLSEAQRAALDEDGFVIVRSLLPREPIDALRARFAAIVDAFAARWLDQGLIDDPREDLDFEHRWAHLRSLVPAEYSVSWRTVLVSPEVHALWQEPHLLGAARSVVGDEVYAHGIWNGRPRDPGAQSAQRVPWHQDAAYYTDWDPADGALLTCWTPLVPVDEESGCLQVARGSHRLPYIPFVHNDYGIRVVPPEVLSDLDPVSAVMDPGDVLFFHATMLHRALDNRSTYTRWSIDVRYGPTTPPIVEKAGPGYLCQSADPSRVESYEDWAARYALGADDDALVRTW